MATKYDRFHFGNVVVNKSAGASNPTKIGMVTHVEVNTGRLNPGPVLNMTDGKGRRWAYCGPPELLEIVGNGLPDRVCP